MPRYAKGQVVEFTGEITSNLLGGAGIISSVKNENGHLVYIVKVTSPPLLGDMVKVGFTVKVSASDITIRRR